MILRQVGVVCLLLALVGSTHADEASAVAALEKLGAKIIRDEKQPGKPVVAVWMSGSQVTDAGLKELKELKHLTTLVLMGTQVTNAGLRDFKAVLPNCKVIKR